MPKKTKNDFPTEVKQSAHKVWLAGLGALATAEEEGSKFFSHLVKKGEGFETRSKKQVDKIVDTVQGKVQETVSDVRGEAEKGWNRIGRSFDEKVATAIQRLGVPSREEIQKLTKRVEDLTGKVDELKPRASRSKRPAKKATRKTTRKSA